MAVSIPISFVTLISTPRTPLSSSFSSSNSIFFNTYQTRKFLCPLQSSLERINAGRSRKRLSCNCLFGLGVPELVVIAGVAALVFGPKKLPEVGRSIGKTVKSFQQAAKEFESELKKDPESVSNSPAEMKPISNEDEEEKDGAEV